MNKLILIATSVFALSFSVSSHANLKPLVGLQIIDFEAPVRNLTATQITVVKKKYERAVNVVVTELKVNFNEPQTTDELKTFFTTAISRMWENFAQCTGFPDCKDTDPLLIDSFSKKRNDGKFGSVDCDTSAIFIADVLNQFGITSRLVEVTGHILLHISSGDVSLYAETFKEITFYNDLVEVERHYSIVFEEYNFSFPSSLHYIRRGFAYAGTYKVTLALADFDKAIELNSKSDAAYINRSVVKLELGDYEGALVDINVAMDLNPNDFYLYNNRGYIKLKSGNFKDAIEDFDFVLRIVSHHSYALNHRGLARFKLNDIEGALRDINRSILYDQKNAEAYRYRAEIKLHMGDEAGAAEDLKTADSLTSN